MALPPSPTALSPSPLLVGPRPDGEPSTISVVSAFASERSSPSCPQRALLSTQGSGLQGVWAGGGGGDLGSLPGSQPSS